VINKTYATTPRDIQREWWVIDAEGQTLGRLASQIAQILRGKYKPYFTPNLDTGDNVIVINAGKIRVSGDRLDQKRYWRHSGYPGGIRSVALRDQLRRHPERPLRAAVKGMLPSNSALGRAMLRKLHIYVGDTHPHEAQNPKPYAMGASTQGN